MYGFHLFSGAFTDDHAGCHRVTTGDSGHDGTIGDTQVFDTKDLEGTVDDGEAVTSHLCRANLVPEAQRTVAHIGHQLLALEIARHDLTLDEWAQRRRIPEFTHILNTFHCKSQVVGMPQAVMHHPHWLSGICARQFDGTAT